MSNKHLSISAIVFQNPGALSSSKVRRCLRNISPNTVQHSNEFRIHLMNNTFLNEGESNTCAAKYALKGFAESESLQLPSCRFPKLTFA